MTHLVSSSPPISGAHTVKRYAGYGILGADIPATGESGRASALNDTIDPAGEYYWRIDTPPSGASGGTLTIYPDMSYTFTGAADGSWPWTYHLFKTGQDLGLATVTQTVGTASGLSVGLTGQAYSVVQGALAKAFAAGLTGQAFTFSQGALAKAYASSLTGVSSTFAQGSLAKALAAPVTGQSFTISQGSIGVVTGTLITVGLTGQAVSFAQGSMGRAVATPILGTSYSYAQGLVSTSRQQALSGTQFSYASGSISASAQAVVNVAMAGQGYAFSSGSLGKSLTVGLSGRTYAFSYGAFSLQGAVSAIPFVSQSASVIWSGNAAFVRGSNRSVFSKTESDQIFIRQTSKKRTQVN